MTLKEIVYMILDEVKITSDDSIITEEHVIFLLGKYRSFLIKKELEKEGKLASSNNEQTICLDLIEVPAIEGMPCEDGPYLRSIEKIPNLLLDGMAHLYPTDFFYFNANIVLVPKERMRWTGHNKYMKNIIYASKGPDGYLYLKSSNPQFLYLENLKLTGIFEDYEEALKLSCEGNAECTDKLDTEFPIDSSLVPILMEAVVKEILGAEYRPKDDNNNANDDLSDLATFIRLNTKTPLSKAIDGDS